MVSSLKHECARNSADAPPGKSETHGSLVDGLEPGRGGIGIACLARGALRETADRVARGEEKHLNWEQAKAELRKGGK